MCPDTTAVAPTAPPADVAPPPVPPYTVATLLPYLDELQRLQGGDIATWLALPDGRRVPLVEASLHDADGGPAVLLLAGPAPAPETLIASEAALARR